MAAAAEEEAPAGEVEAPRPPPRGAAALWLLPLSISIYLYLNLKRWSKRNIYISDCQAPVRADDGRGGVGEGIAAACYCIYLWAGGVAPAGVDGRCRKGTVTVG
jgi:hypothetical protein